MNKKNNPEWIIQAARPKCKNDVQLEDTERTRCEIWTRVMGYHRPLSDFNEGKKAEHKQRKYFVEGKI